MTWSGTPGRATKPFKANGVTRFRVPCEVADIPNFFTLDTETGALLHVRREAGSMSENGPWDRVSDWNKMYAGKEAGWVMGNGYRLVSINGEQVLAHRVVFALVHGFWPTKQIDHINGDRLDNRPCNLRQVSPLENNRNTKRRSDNTSGHTGVVWSKLRQKWIATIHCNGKPVHLGIFADKHAAIAARHAGEIRFGFHSNHGRR